MWTSSPAAVMPEMPGIEVRISVLRLRRSSLRSSFWISASTSFRWRLISASRLFVDPLGQRISQVLAPVDDGSLVCDQRIAHQLQFGKLTLAPGLAPGRAQIVDRGRHDCQRACVDSVRLGARSQRPGEAPDLVGVDRVQRNLRLQQGFLEVAMPGASGLVGDPVDLCPHPGDQLPEPGRVVRKAGGLGLGCAASRGRTAGPASCASTPSISAIWVARRASTSSTSSTKSRSSNTLEPSRASPSTSWSPC